MHAHERAPAPALLHLHLQAQPMRLAVCACASPTHASGRIAPHLLLPACARVRTLCAVPAPWQVLAQHIPKHLAPLLNQACGPRSGGAGT